MFLYGGGGIGVVAVDVLLDNHQEISCIIDEAPARTSVLGVPVFPSFSVASEHFPDIKQGLICIGNNETRRTLVSKFDLQYASAVSKSARISKYAEIGAGALIFHSSTVQACTSIGRHIIINTSASVDHDCEIGDFVHIGPNSTLCGHVTIRDGVDIGAACTFIPGVTVGEGSIVGAGSVVLSDIPPRSLAVGTPARVVRSW